MPTTRPAVLYAALFLELGINLPFFPIWLQSRSIDEAMIGVILAAPLVARIVANPLVATLADRSGDVARTLAVCAVAVVAGTVALALVDTAGPILLVVTITALAQGPLIALLDAYLWLHLAARHDPAARPLVYGRIRLWGSCGFVAATLGAGWMLDRLQASAVLWMLIGAAIATAVAAVAVAYGARAPAVPAPTAVAPAGAVAHPLRLVAVIAGVALVQASHALYYAFSSLHWRDAGWSGTLVGSLWATAVVAEVAVFAFAGRALAVAAAPMLLLMAGAAAAVLRWLVMALDPGVGVVLLLQVTHGLTFGATHLGSMAMLARLAPAGVHARAQDWLAAAWAGAMAALTAVGGVLYASLGERAYAVMAAVAATGLVLLVSAAVADRRHSRPMPRLSLERRG
nr:MFS transporter [Rhodoplanes serenus]